MSKYQYGLDMGRVFVNNGKPIPWTGLSQVEDKRLNAELIPIYHDGIRYDTISEPMPTGVKITCYTYPSALDAVTGFYMDDVGILYDQQPLEYFSFSYRVLTDDGYKIVIIFNIKAIPGNYTATTMEKTPSPQLFTFDGECTPIPRPKNIDEGRIITGVHHFSRMEFDSTRLSKDLMDSLVRALDKAPMTLLIPVFMTFTSEDDLRNYLDRAASEIL